MLSTIRTVAAAVTATVALTLLPTFAYSQAVATFVSSSGNDNNKTNNCPRLTPCASLTAALSVTQPGGVVSCTDSVLGFGPLTIAQDVTIDCSEAPYILSSIPFTGSDGIYINTSGINVTLRGLIIFGAEIPLNEMPNGIQILSAASVRIEKCKIFGAIAGGGSGGIEVTPSAGNLSIKVLDSTVTRSDGGINIAPTGSAAVELDMERSQVENNIGGGVRIDTTGGGTVTATISDSHMSFNGGNAVNAIGGASGSVLANLTDDIIASNAAAGVQAKGSSVVTVSRSTLSNNGSAWSIVGSATLLSFKNNEVTGPTGNTPSPASFQ